MICPECKMKYVSNIKECSSCQINLVETSTINKRLKRKTWSPLSTFSGRLLADMVAEVLDQHSIPYHLKMDWISSALSVEALQIPGQTVQIFVPTEYLSKASELTSSITGELE